MTYKYHCLNCFENWNDNIQDAACPKCGKKLTVWADYYGAKNSMYDPVEKPAHYNQGEIACIDAIHSALDAKEFVGYIKGTVMKYVWREQHKGGRQDLQKAAWFLRKLEEYAERLTTKREV